MTLGNGKSFSHQVARWFSWNLILHTVYRDHSQFHIDIFIFLEICYIKWVWQWSFTFYLFLEVNRLFVDHILEYLYSVVDHPVGVLEGPNSILLKWGGDCLRGFYCKAYIWVPWVFGGPPTCDSGRTQGYREFLVDHPIGFLGGPKGILSLWWIAHLGLWEDPRVSS